MQITVKNLIPATLLTAALVSCGTTEEAHYRDTSMLEKPPTLAAGKPVEEQKEADSSAEPEEEEAKTGLGTKVYMTDSNSTLFVIKQPFDEAWNTLAQALKQQDIEITDRNREEKAYYVTYDPDDYDPGSSFSFFKDDYAEEDYLLKLEARDDGTAISAEAVDKPDPDNSSDDGRPTDGAEKLLKSLHITLRDDLKEE
jgi:uncharacterized lipoprotein